MKFYFCETCGKRLTEKDIHGGVAKDKKLKGVYCTECAIGVSTMDTVPMSNEQAKELLQESKESPSKRASSASARARRRTSGVRKPGEHRSSGKIPAVKSSSSTIPAVPAKGIPVWGVVAIGSGVAIAVVLGVLLVWGTSAEVPRPKTVKKRTREPDAPKVKVTSGAKNEGVTTATAPPADANKQFVPSVRTDKKAPTPPPPDPEQVAREAFDAIAGGEKDIDARIGELEKFLELHGQTIVALQAKRLLKKLKAKRDIARAVADGGEIVFQYGVSPTPDYHDMQDTSLYGTRGAAAVMYSYQSGEPLAIRFGLGQIPKDAGVLKATLMLYQTEKVDYPHPNSSTSVYRLTESWKEMEANRDFRSKGVRWQTRLGTIDTSAKWGGGEPGVVVRRRMIDDQNKLILKDGWAAFDITPLVRDWVTGKRENHGLTFRNSPHFIIRWHTKECAEPKKRPKLVIVLGDPETVSALASGKHASSGSGTTDKAAIDAAKKAVTEARLMAALEAFEQTLRKEGADEAVQAARTKLAKPETEKFKSELEALVPLAAAARARLSKRRRAWAALADGKARVIRTRKGIVKGTVKNVADDGLKVLVRGKINNQAFEYEKQVSRADITPEGMRELLKIPPPQSPQEWMVEAVLACMDRDLKQAGSALESVGKQPLAEIYTRRLTHVAANASEDAARQEWERLETEGNKKLTQTQAGRLLRDYKAFDGTYGATTFHKENNQAISVLRRQLNDIATDMKSQVMKLFRGHIRGYDVRKRHITVLWDFSHERQKKDIDTVWHGKDNPSTIYRRIYFRKNHVYAHYGNALNVQFRFHQFDSRDVSVKVSYRNGRDQQNQMSYCIGLGLPQKPKMQSNVYFYANRVFSGVARGRRQGPGQAAPAKATIELACHEGTLEAKIDGKVVGEQTAPVKNPPPGVWLGGGWDCSHEITSIMISGRIHDGWLKKALAEQAAKKKQR